MLSSAATSTSSSPYFPSSTRSEARSTVARRSTSLQRREATHHGAGEIARKRLAKDVFLVFLCEQDAFIETEGAAARELLHRQQLAILRNHLVAHRIRDLVLARHVARGHRQHAASRLVLEDTDHGRRMLDVPHHVSAGGEKRPAQARDEVALRVLGLQVYVGQHLRQKRASLQAKAAGERCRSTSQAQQHVPQLLAHDQTTRFTSL